jgi:ribosome-associated heat shock protein Hsp15
MNQDCRIDVWLWRARFFKTRSLAGRFVEAGRIRLTRLGAETRIDKPSRGVKAGDELVFAVGGRLVALRVCDVGERRGPATEARTLYADLDGSSGGRQEHAVKTDDARR